MAIDYFILKYYGYVLVILCSFAIVHFSMPFFIRRMHAQKIVWGDFNKEGKPPVAGMGGIVVLLAFIGSMMLALFLRSYSSIFPFADYFPNIELIPLLAAMLTIIIVGVVGIVDDIIGWTKGIRQYQHALFPVFAALPIMVLPETIGNSGVLIPFLGFVNFGIFYSLFLVPIAITGASNASNMLAGLNGLEAGMGLVSSIALLIVALVLGEVSVAILLLGIIGALLAFLKFNWTPAKVFPGDSLTLMMGATIAAATIIGNMERVGLMLFSLYFVELTLKARTKMQAQGFGIIQPDGTLKAPEKIGSLTHVVMRMGNFTEKQVVMIILGMQVGVALITLLVFWLNFTLVPVSTVSGGIL